MSEATKFDVVGVGNAIVDVLGKCDDAFLAAHDAPKGHMRLVDADTVMKLYDDMGPAIEVSGGSAANTIVGVASLGGQSAYIGKVADDEFGRIFTHDLRAAGVTYETQPKSGSEPTARSLVLVTPDGERTMSTFLGVSPELNGEDLDDELIASGKILYLEGYLFDRPEAQAAFHKAGDVARSHGRQVALTLSDGFCVERHRDAFKALLNGPVDILFANESELLALSQTNSFNDALDAVGNEVDWIAATRNKDGSLIRTSGTDHAVPSIQLTP